MRPSFSGLATRIGVAALVACAASGCGLLFDPCGDLDERLCADLGPADCAVFRANPSIHESVIPIMRRRGERAQCEMFAAEVNYSSYTLPWIRYLVEQSRNPGTRTPNLPAPQPVDGLASGVSGNFLYLLPVISIALIFFVSWRARRKLATAQPGAFPMVHAPTGFDHVRSREEAEALVATGVLVRVELLPSWMGGPAVPENTAYVTPAAAARKAALDQEVAAMVQARGPVRYACEPRYKGASFVPASLFVRADEHSTTIDVW